MGCKVSFFAVVASTLSLQSLATNYDALGYPDENGNFVLTEEGRKFWGRTPKTLGFFAIFGFCEASRQLRRSSEGAGASRRLFDGADTTGEIRFTSVRPRRKQKRRILFTFGMSCPRDHRKRQSERSPARSRRSSLTATR